MSLKIYTIETRDAFIPGAAAYALGLSRASVQGHVYVAAPTKKAAIERLKAVVTYHANTRNVHIATGLNLDALLATGALAEEGQVLIKDANGPKVVLYCDENKSFIYIGKILPRVGNRCGFEASTPQSDHLARSVADRIRWEHVSGGDTINAYKGFVGDVQCFAITGHSVEGGYTLRFPYISQYFPPLSTVGQAKELAANEWTLFLDRAGLAWKDQG